jgi:hypothetical protein
MRRRIHRATMTWLAAAAIWAGTARELQADFMFVSESAIFDPITADVQFTIKFNAPPDFFTLDVFGRQANSFQYFVVGDPNLPYPELYDAIIRGDEIHVTGSTVRIRNSGPPDPDLASGGWGAIRGSVPFSVDGKILTFSIPLNLISDHSRDGNFAYRLESYEFGRLTRFLDSQSAIVPEPATGVSLVLGGVTLCCWYGRRRLISIPYHRNIVVVIEACSRTKLCRAGGGELEQIQAAAGTREYSDDGTLPRSEAGSGACPNDRIGVRWHG